MYIGDLRSSGYHNIIPFPICRGHPQKLDAGGAPAERHVGERDARPAAPVVPGRGRGREHGANVGRQATDELRPVQAGASVRRDDVEVRQRR